MSRPGIRAAENETMTPTQAPHAPWHDAYDRLRRHRAALFGLAVGLAIDSRGRLFVADAGNHRMQVWGAQ